MDCELGQRIEMQESVSKDGQQCKSQSKSKSGENKRKKKTKRKGMWNCPHAG